LGARSIGVQLVEEIILVSLGVRALPEIIIACKKRKGVVEGGEGRRGEEWSFDCFLNMGLIVW
jgi:hypothetical protein